MAKKKEFLNFWCPIGVGVLAAGAPLKWPSAGDELMAVGAAVIIASLIHQRLNPAVSILLGALSGGFIFGCLHLIDPFPTKSSAARPISAPAPGAAPEPPYKIPLIARMAYSSYQTINTLPPSLGGSNTINLDTAGTLKRFVPYSIAGVSMMLDATPVYFPPTSTPEAQIEERSLVIGIKKVYYFDTDQGQRQKIMVAGRTFAVTLLSIRVLDVTGVSNPLEYKFGISEE